MKKWIFLFCLVTLSNTLLATTTCPPTDNCGLDAADLETAPPVYYPPPGADDPNAPINPGVAVSPEPDTSSPDTN